LQQHEIHSVRSLAQELNISLTKIHARLTGVVGFFLRHPREVPHFLTDELKAIRVSTSIEMLEILEHQKRIHFAGIITGDESWFFLEYSRNHAWRLGDKNAQEGISQNIDREKHILTIFWFTTGPLVEDWLPTNALFHSPYFCELIALCVASAAFPDQAGQGKRQVYLHMDNASPHNSRK
jgi:hypothetical protein